MKLVFTEALVHFFVALLASAAAAGALYWALQRLLRRALAELQAKRQLEQRLTLTADIFQKLYKDLFDYKEVMVALHAQMSVWLFMNEKKYGQTFPRDPLIPSIESAYAKIHRLSQSLKAAYQQGKPLFNIDFQEQMNEFLKQGGSLAPELQWFHAQCAKEAASGQFVLTQDMSQSLRRIRDELYQKEQQMSQWLPLLRDCYYRPVMEASAGPDAALLAGSPPLAPGA
jgi:hypothetical protein